jgi:hypothetical protein
VAFRHVPVRTVRVARPFRAWRRSLDPHYHLMGATGGLSTRAGGRETFAPADEPPVAHLSEGAACPRIATPFVPRNGPPGAHRDSAERHGGRSRHPNGPTTNDPRRDGVHLTARQESRMDADEERMRADKGCLGSSLPSARLAEPGPSARPQRSAERRPAGSDAFAPAPRSSRLASTQAARHVGRCRVGRSQRGSPNTVCRRTERHQAPAVGLAPLDPPYAPYFSDPRSSGSIRVIRVPFRSPRPERKQKARAPSGSQAR